MIAILELGGGFEKAEVYAPGESETLRGCVRASHSLNDFDAAVSCQSGMAAEVFAFGARQSTGIRSDVAQLHSHLYRCLEDGLIGNLHDDFERLRNRVELYAEEIMRRRVSALWRLASALLKSRAIDFKDASQIFHEVVKRSAWDYEHKGCEHRDGCCTLKFRPGQAVHLPALGTGRIIGISQEQGVYWVRFGTSGALTTVSEECLFPG